MGVAIDMRISRQIGFGHTHFDADFLVDGLHGKEVVRDGLLFGRIVPLPATLPALDEDSTVVDGETKDEFDGQMLVENEHFRQKPSIFTIRPFSAEAAPSIPLEGRSGYDFPKFTMGARYALAGLNQFQ